MNLSSQIGRCTTCIYDNCPTPSVKKKPGGNCSFWLNGKPAVIRKSELANNDPSYDHFKGIKESGHFITRRLNECPKCSGHMDTLTCSSCGYEFELEGV